MNSLSSRILASTGIVATGLIALAALNYGLSVRAERKNPPKGGFMRVGRTRLHYLDKGEGKAIVLFHGNGSAVDDFVCGGLVDELSKRYRVIAFDRPGFGHSSVSPQGCDPVSQAEIFAEALAQLDVQDATIVGHSWGTLVAIAMAKARPFRVDGLVLVSGYYFAESRVGLALGSLAAVPFVGPLLSHTILPPIARVMWPFLVKALFSPRSAESFDHFPKELAFRPSQIEASARETAMLNPATRGLTEKLQTLAIHVVILAGAEDKIVNSNQSKRLHHEVPGSRAEILHGHGHMLHHTAAAEVIAAVESVSARASKFHAVTALQH